MKNIIWLFFLSFLLVSCGGNSGSSFKKVSPKQSGIHFLNELIENDTLNYTIFPYMYMGGGVSVGDINNDELPDIFFTGNLVPNKLYLNKGNMEFEDISLAAGIEGEKQWFTGSTMADVNNDGWLDIYVCVSAKYEPSGNVLYINNRDNTFTESAQSYGIADHSSSIQATFFDYNNDGHQDLYVANYPIVMVTMGATYYYDKMQENSYEESGHLYRNNGDGSFSCVTEEAGVKNFGMSIGLVAMDFNNDGWKDLYISNDFNVPDYFYLNNGDGTFTDVVREACFQTSIFGMGFDAADINNDGLLDMFQIDMTPEDHFRAMTQVAPMSRQTFEESLDYGFGYQYMQNSLQLNNGIFNNMPIYSNISLFSEVAYTDWSWGGIFLDMDNDGNKDLFVTNGVLKDINDRDILSTSNKIYFRDQQEYSPDLFPSTPLKNFAFRNNGDLSFSNFTDRWNFKEATLTNGMSYGDFDNDGDLDIVVSNVNELSCIYENRAVSRNDHYLKVRLKGPEFNSIGLGSIVSIQCGEKRQKQELTLTRGYQSSVPPVLHFGTGKNELIDKLLVSWPDGKQELLENVSCDQLLVLDYSSALPGDKLAANALSLFPNDSERITPDSDFKDITRESGINFVHREDPYDDYVSEPMLPHKNSRMGPGLTVADVNADGLEDFFIGNAAGSSASMFLQREKGAFAEVPGPWQADSLFEDAGALLFDANQDGKPDLYVVSGGNDPGKAGDYLQDRLYLNTDQGFIRSRESLPAGRSISGQCVEAADYDGDGDLDLFLGGRIVPGSYPSPASSMILRNNGLSGTEVRFEDVSEEIAPDLTDMGLVTDAVWNDFDGDGDEDLVVVGEWMSIRFLKNQSGIFVDVTENMGFDETTGWWFSLSLADVDGDGDDDFIAGNLGLNYRYKVSEEEPFDIYLSDFDINGKADIVISYGENGRNLPLRGLNESSRQIPVLKMRYETHESFARATTEEIYGEQMLEAALHYRINTFAHHWIENLGSGSFTMHKLPDMAQLSSINDLAVLDYGDDGPAFIVAGNLYGSEVETPRNDASVGLVLKSDSHGQDGLTAIPPPESSLMIKGEVKAIREINLASGQKAYLFAINNDSLKLISAPGL